MTDQGRMMSDLLSLSVVPRWAIVGAARYQSVAEHSYRVAVIARSIVLRSGQPSVRDLGAITEWALLHDGAECVTGDLPSIVKRKLYVKSAIRELEGTLCPWYAEVRSKVGTHSLAIVKIADLLEGASFISQWGQGPIGVSASVAGDTILDISAEMVAQARMITNEYGISDSVEKVLGELGL